MATYTSSLPDQLLQKLEDTARRLKLPKNRLIENALAIYLDQLNKAEYIKSYRNADDADIISIAEEGMGDYLTQLQDSDEAG